MSFSSMAQVKLGFVDFQKFMDTLPSRKVALVKYQEHEKSLIDELQGMRAEYEKMVADYQAKVGGLTPVLRQSFEKRISDKQRQFQERQEAMQAELEAYGEELNIPILDKITKAVNIVAERQKLSMVVDKSTTLYYDPTMEITSLVVVELLRIDKESK